MILTETPSWYNRQKEATAMSYHPAARPNLFRRLDVSIITKKCSRCGEVKELDKFSKVKAYKDGLRYNCKSCVKIYMDEYNKHPESLKRSRDFRRKHPRYFTAYAKKYRQNNKYKESAKKYQQTYRAKPKKKEIRRIYSIQRRALKANALGMFTPEDFRNLCELYNNKCVACKNKRKLTVDHIVPLSKGGSNYLSNIQPLCGSCNSSKGVKSTDFR